MTLLDNVFNFPDLLHIQRDYNWDFILPAIAPVPGIIVSKYCQSVQVGQYNIEEIIETKRGVEKTFQPGSLNVQSLKATFIAPAPDIIATYFHAWKNLIIDENGYYGLPNEYKKTASVVLYDTSLALPTNVITVKGMFPKTFPAFNLSYDSEGLVKHEIEFSFDKVDFGLSAIGGAVGAVASSIGIPINL